MIGVVARGVCSPLGEGADAVRVGVVGEPADSRVVRDEELTAAGLARPFAARARMVVPDSVDRATALLEYAMTECARELDHVLPRWRSMRVGAAIGTSSGGMRSFEAFNGKFGRADASPDHAALYVGPLIDAARPCAFEPVALVLGACASSTLAIGLGRAWLLDDRCDVVLCGGFDAVSVFVAAGFECLRATCGSRGPRPFREDRDGLALGEGAAILALVRDPCVPVHAWITGFGASCDAAHLTAPDRAGTGLARAADHALRDAGHPAIDLVSAHGTATQQNDAAEVAALGAVLRSAVPVFSFKGTIGHTLGAAGALEVLATMDAMERGIAPASAGEGPVDGGLQVLDRAETSTARTALKLSAAFGGANAALVVSADPPRPLAGGSRSTEGIHVSRAVSVTLADTDPARLAARTGYGVERILRADDLVRLAIAAVAALEDVNGGPGSMRGAGIIIGHGLATIETNALFLARIGAAGAARAEPRRFPYTTPNAAAGECAVAFGLTGPSFAVGGGPHGGIEAIAVAADLVRSGLVDRVVAVAADAAGEASERIAPGTTSGAVAVLVADARLGVRAAARLDAYTVRLEATTILGRLPPMDAHRALLPLVGGRPAEVTAEVPWGGFAKARLFWL